MLWIKIGIMIFMKDIEFDYAKGNKWDEFGITS